jgi:hypothetical protein
LEIRRSFWRKRRIEAEFNWDVIAKRTAEIGKRKEGRGGKAEDRGQKLEGEKVRRSEGGRKVR